MDDLREDALTGRRVMIAEHRAGRPNEYSASSLEEEGDTPRDDCVFCPGNEAETPETRLELPGDDGRWRVRVVPNKYPAVGVGGRPGVHEVIIESPCHCRRTGDLSNDQLAAVLTVYAQRLRSLARDGVFPYRLIFKNVGASAGASLTHLHSQVVALPSVPPAAAAERERLAAHAERTGRCGWCDRIAEELASGERVVAVTDQWIALCPSASRQPYETWLMPRAHQPAFESVAPKDAASLALLMLPVVRAIEGEIGKAGYNLMIHTFDGGVEQPGGGHWRIEIVPRVASLAGLELATGLFLNVLSPERAAAALRERIGARQPASS
ncbi:MAG: DUF4921 family protein [Planctomycetota bacterium]